VIALCEPVFGVTLGVASDELDTLEATDLVGPGLHVGQRIRGFKYLNLRRPEFTLRDSRPSGAKTELEKVLSGCGTHAFNGWLTQSGDRIGHWLIADLGVFRNEIERARKGLRAEPEYIPLQGPVGVGFRAYPVDQFPLIVIASNFVKVERPMIEGRQRTKAMRGLLRASGAVVEEA